MAPLLSQSPNAYMLWMLRQDREGRPQDEVDQRLPIVALVDIDAGRGDLERTLQSLLAEGITAFVIGSADTSSLADVVEQIDWHDDTWIMPVMAGDVIAPGAARAYREAIGNATSRIIYADDDHLGRLSRYDTPHFKPDWNSELFRHFDYLTHACIVNTSRDELAALAGDGEWAQELVVRATVQGRPQHLRNMLHHRRARLAPRVPRPATVVSDRLPPVTIVVPTRDRLELLQTCLDGIAATAYPDIEVIVVDNGSNEQRTLDYLAALDPARCRVLHHAGAFNYSAINNRAVAEARGRLICLLNNDTEVIDPQWLATMVVQALRDDVGAVGARLLYPDGRIQHAGVVVGVGNAAGHAHRFLHPDEEGYFRRHALPQFTSAVTAACMVVQRERFLAVGGLDERNFAVAFNDVDLCLRLNQRGWQSLYEPRATLIHHESVSRGFDLDPVGAERFAGELMALKRIWGTDNIVDPFHHPQLSRASERFAVAI